MSRAIFLLVLWGSLLLVAPAAQAEPAPRPASPATDRSLAGRSLAWPSADQWRRVLLLEDYNTRVVLLGTMLLGCASGMVGSFMLLRKRALMGDALSHATLPGICLAFLVATRWGGDGKSLPLLLLGATVTGLLGVAAILLIRNLTRLKEDTALGAVLSVFFGAGAALLGLIQQMEKGHAAGLESFVYGKTASMGTGDTTIIAVSAFVCVVACVLLFKELKLLCFDEGFAGAAGMPVLFLDLTLMALVVVVTIVGLQAVGLILMVAMLVIPAAAARFWTEKLSRMFLISGGLGAFSGLAGAGVSALFSKVPSGAMIVLVSTALFGVSLVFGSARGVLHRVRRRWDLARSIDRQHLLRAIHELQEASTGSGPASSANVTFADLLRKRSWSPARLRGAIQRARQDELIEWGSEPIRLTRRGALEGIRLTRQHRLWELYLIAHADIAPSRVDRDADAIEHVLEPEVIAELEELLQQGMPGAPASPHGLESAPSATARTARPKGVR